MPAPGTIRKLVRKRWRGGADWGGGGAIPAPAVIRAWVGAMPAPGTTSLPARLARWRFNLRPHRRVSRLRDSSARWGCTPP